MLDKRSLNQGISTTSVRAWVSIRETMDPVVIDFGRASWITKSDTSSGAVADEELLEDEVWEKLEAHFKREFSGVQMMKINLTDNVIGKAKDIAVGMKESGDEIRELSIGDGHVFVASKSELLVEPETISVDGTDFLCKNTESFRGNGLSLGYKY